MITAQMVKYLRDITGAGMMDCKRALVACDEDMLVAKHWLRIKGTHSRGDKLDLENAITYAAYEVAKEVNEYLSHIYPSSNR